MVVALVALLSSLTGGAVAARLITTKDVKNGSLLAKDFRKGQLPQKGAVKMARGGPNNFTLLNANEEKQVVSLSIRAPAKGYVWLNYTATIDNKTPVTWLNVFVMEGDKRLNGVEWWDPGDADDNFDHTQGNQIVLPVTKGRHTYSLRLKMSTGTAGAHDARMTALYAPSSL
jgi:hypothetical protein